VLYTLLFLAVFLREDVVVGDSCHILRRVAPQFARFTIEDV
jgi:hypothetical protein